MMLRRSLCSASSSVSSPASISFCISDWSFVIWIADAVADEVGPAVADLREVERVAEQPAMVAVVPMPRHSGWSLA